MSILNKLENYCREENSLVALMLMGEWKTCLIENKLPKQLGENFIIIRISLFGE